MKIGLDVGSTTIKCVVLDGEDNIRYKSYERHYSQVVEKAREIIGLLQRDILDENTVQVAVSGSAGMGIAQGCGLPFVQEVYATRVAVKRHNPDADTVVELGGEDAKILFLTGNSEVRMNGACAGGTGAFIDQMATLLGIAPDQMNEMAARHTHLYEIASRCGVFAKSDIQPLLNQGARLEDIAASIFYAVVNQTVAGLAQGRPIRGQVLYLGGPLTFLSELRKSFDSTLNLTGVCPENSLYYVALGAAHAAQTSCSLREILRGLEQYRCPESYDSNPPLFADPGEYEKFLQRHRRASVPTGTLAGYTGPVTIGIDAGSTTVKMVVVGEQGELLFDDYQPNSNNPVTLVRAFLIMLYTSHPTLHIQAAAVTGYGEELIQNAFGVDYGIVETVAHFTAAHHFLPQVDFVIDIGGQDIKCFKVRDGVVDNIFLNEACSSGCGSFLQTFANALGYSVEDFSKLGLFAPKPVSLGSRCTVFMNSSVKQAQKDGASMEDISAGLSVSVVKNALYKVIRATCASDLGEHVVVQGGTFLNDAVLRSFEQELDIQVVRPQIAGLMGAYGAALYARSRATYENRTRSSLILLPEFDTFTHRVTNTVCKGCGNRCQLSINTFGGGRRFVGGNRCEKPVTDRSADNSLNLYEFKRGLLAEYERLPLSPQDSFARGRIGIPMALNMFELLAFWQTLFSHLGFEVVTSPRSTRELYIQGQQTIPSDTVCFPAKLAHGHVQALLDSGVQDIFYPCMSYNFDEGLGDNHYNCPVVAYYPEVIAANMDLGGARLIYDYVGPHRRHDFPQKMSQILARYYTGITTRQTRAAAAAAYAEYDRFRARVREEGDRIMRAARAQGRQMIVLAGRPYHIDPQVNHGIDQLIAGFGYAVLTEDCVSDLPDTKVATQVLNQWTYHSRLYAAAQYVCKFPDMQLVQLVSFGCGVDAITTDETRRILKEQGRLYTQIKIDEITNLGAVKIRLRSLFAAIPDDVRQEVRV